MPAIDKLVNFVGIQGLNREVPKSAVLEAMIRDVTSTWA